MQGGAQRTATRGGKGKRVVVLKQVRRAVLPSWWQQLRWPFSRAVSPTSSSTSTALESRWSEQELLLRAGDTVLWVWDHGPCNVEGKKFGLRAFANQPVFTSGKPTSSGSFAQTFTKGGTYEVCCTAPYPSRSEGQYMRCRVTVRTEATQLLYSILGKLVYFACAAILLVAFVVACLLALDSQVSSLLPDEDSLFGAVVYDLFDVLRSYVLPPFILGVGMLGVIIPFALLMTLRPPKLVSFGRGYGITVHRRVRVCLFLVLLGLLAVLLLDWRYTVRTTQNILDVFNRATSLLAVNLHTIDIVAGDTKALLEWLEANPTVAPDMRAALGVGSSVEKGPLSDGLERVREIRDEVAKYADTSQQFFTAFARMVQALDALALLAGLTAVGLGSAGMIRGHVGLTKGMGWLAALALALSCVGMSLQWPLAHVSAGLRDAVADLQAQHSMLEVEGVPVGALVLSYCGAGSNGGGGALEDAGTWLRSVAMEVNALAGEQVVEVGSADGEVTTEELRAQAASLQFWVGSLVALNTTELSAEYGDGAQLRVPLTLAVSIARELVSLIACDDDSVWAYLLSLQQQLDDLTSNLWQWVGGKAAQGALLLLSLVGSAVAAFVLQRPRKYWQLESTGRWFRFRACFLVHKRLQARKEQRRKGMGMCQPQSRAIQQEARADGGPSSVDVPIEAAAIAADAHASEPAAPIGREGCEPRMDDADVAGRATVPVIGVGQAEQPRQSDPTPSASEKRLSIKQLKPLPATPTSSKVLALTDVSETSGLSFLDEPPTEHVASTSRDGVTADPDGSARVAVSVSGATMGSWGDEEDGKRQRAEPGGASQERDGESEDGHAFGLLSVLSLGSEIEWWDDEVYWIRPGWSWVAAEERLSAGFTAMQLVVLGVAIATIVFGYDSTTELDMQDESLALSWVCCVAIVLSMYDKWVSWLPSELAAFHAASAERGAGGRRVLWWVRLGGRVLALAAIAAAAVVTGLACAQAASSVWECVFDGGPGLSSSMVDGGGFEIGAAETLCGSQALTDRGTWAMLAGGVCLAAAFATLMGLVALLAGRAVSVDALVKTATALERSGRSPEGGRLGGLVLEAQGNMAHAQHGAEGASASGVGVGGRKEQSGRRRGADRWLHGTWARSLVLVLGLGLLGGLLVLVMGIGEGADEPSGQSSESACNGVHGLCTLRYDQAVYGVVHNAMSSSDDGFALPNNIRSMQLAMQSGIRGLMLDLVLDSRGAARLCHGECLLGSTDLLAGLTVIKDFLAANEREVVTVIWELFEGDATGALKQQLEAAVDELGLDAVLHQQAARDAWPSLGAMVDSDKRLVFFTPTRGARAWDHYTADFIDETSFAIKSRSEIEGACEQRGDDKRPLFLMNHFITNPLASPTLAATINYKPFLLDRARRCEGFAAGASRELNFIAVDFWSLSHLTAVVQTLNVDRVLDR